MRILKLNFLNINSLKGEHEIVFDQEPFLSSSLFAIVGPTGAGKSSILDAITLALYKNVPRFKSISDSEIERHGSIITHFTDAARAEVTYEVDGIVYRSKWQMEKARTGNWKSYEMEVVEVATGKPLTTKKSDAPLVNEKIIGLNYDQFVKSILLSQGEFSRFLKADPQERASLLEKITGTEIYREIGKKVHLKHKLEEEKIKDKLLEINAIEVLSEEESQSTLTELESCLQKVKKSDEELKVLEEIQSRKQEILKLNDELQIVKKDWQGFEEKQETFKLQKEKIDTHKSLMPFQSDIIDLQKASANSKRLKQEKTELEDQLKHAKKAYSEVIAKMKNLSKKTVEESNFLSVMKEIEDKYNGLKRDLQEVEKVGMTAKSELIGILAKEKGRLKHDFDIKSRPNAIIEWHKSYAEKLEAYLKNSEHQAKSVDQLSEEIQQVNDDKIQWNKALDSGNRLKELDLQNEKNSKSITEYQKESKVLHLEKENLNTQLDTVNKELNTIAAEKIRQTKEASLEELRNELVDEEPCPLCGSTDHPYAVHKVLADIGLLAVKEAKIGEEIDKIRQAQNKVISRIAAIDSAIQQWQSSISENKIKIEEIRLQLGKESRTHEELVKLVDDSSLKIQHLSAVRNVKLIEPTLDQIGKLAKEWLEAGKQHKSTTAELKEIYDGDLDFSSTINSLQNSFVSKKDEILILNNLIAEKEKQHEQYLQVITDIKAKLTKPLFSLGFSHIEDAMSKLLSTEEFNSIESREKELLSLKSSLSTLKTQLAMKLEDTKDSDPRPLSEITGMIADLKKSKDEALNMSGRLQSRLEENSKRKKSKTKLEKQIEKEQKELRKWELLRAEIGDAAGKRFSEFAQELTLAYLIDISNQRLQSINDRYTLFKSPNEKDLQVLDNYQGGTKRSVLTLSGGETFLVSLALALGLSDMASRNVKIQCLFIDEGFGTLDEEGLEAAISTLDRLQSESQKLVGIISHVESLKERITTQIQLTKNSQGYSELLIRS